MRLIDADALIDEVDGDLSDSIAEGRAIEKIMNAPTIEERKKGKWKRHILKNENVPWGYDCSTCGAWFVIGEDTAEKYNYCPNCGARMEASDD